MTPRISLLSCLRALNGFSVVPSHANFCPTLKSSLKASSRNASTVAQRRKHRDPYAIAQAKARKAANLSRQEVLKKERAAALGNPVRGITTPFVQSFDTGLPPSLGRTVGSISKKAGSDSPSPSPRGPDAQPENHLNYSLAPQELQDSLAHSETLSAPIPDVLGYGHNEIENEKLIGKHAANHANAVEALSRITSLMNASSKDRLRANVARCVSTFGRHETDRSLPPRNPAQPIAVSDNPSPQLTPSTLPDTPRAGPDTGSSEVQIAILTAKIRTLANFLETRGKTDKMNKRNLRLLVHRRQKLLAYLRKKERGGPRWQHCIETLGLTEGTWKGEISL
ncbi:MAG: hypothetical protein Q9165_000205 [Trypethelium subeluteriae]